MRRALDGQKGAGYLEGASGKEDLFGKKVHQDIECQAFWRALSVRY